MPMVTTEARPWRRFGRSDLFWRGEWWDVCLEESPPFCQAPALWRLRVVPVGDDSLEVTANMRVARTKAALLEMLRTLQEVDG